MVSRAAAQQSLHLAEIDQHLAGIGKAPFKQGFLLGFVGLAKEGLKNLDPALKELTVRFHKEKIAKSKCLRRAAEAQCLKNVLTQALSPLRLDAQMTAKD